MKIGIMTFWWSQDNYGQLLQCYALQKYLRDLGHDPYTIRFYMDPSRPNFKQKFIKYGLHPWRLLDGFKRIAARRQGTRALAQQPRDFDAFRRKYLKLSEDFYTTHAALKANPPPADAYIVGSDQVWNVSEAYLPGDVNAYYLDFGRPESKRISYAASFGRSSIPESEARRIAPLLKNFTAISVREKSGVDICAKVGARAEWVCDPTLLLKKEDWLTLAETPVLKEKYVFVYMLTNQCAFSLCKLNVWAISKGLKVIYVKGNSLVRSTYEDEGFDITPATIPQWLGYVANAEYVVTNSFHCSVFSLVFERKLGVVNLKGALGASNNRILDLCESTGGKCSYIVDNDYSVLDQAVQVPIKDASSSGKNFLGLNLKA